QSKSLHKKAFWEPSKNSSLQLRFVCPKVNKIYQIVKLTIKKFLCANGIDWMSALKRVLPARAETLFFLIWTELVKKGNMNRPDCGHATNSVQKVGNAGMTKESHAFIPAGICVTSAYVRHH